jgi:hypothetical protein
MNDEPGSGESDGVHRGVSADEKRPIRTNPETPSGLEEN